MKRLLIALTAAGAISVAGFAIARTDEGGPCGRHGGWRGHFGKMTEALNLSPDQQAKVQPILDQAKPQIAAIHEEAMQKVKTIMENTTAQIRPLLTAEQQTKLDTLKQAHEQMRDAHDKMRSLKSE
jgi:Spy/CpxP family protein refolding chaperone